MVEDISCKEHIGEDEDNCDHSFILKDDLGYVCRICGIIERAIETIIEVQFNKVSYFCLSFSLTHLHLLMYTIASILYWLISSVSLPEIVLPWVLNFIC